MKVLIEKGIQAAKAGDASTALAWFQRAHEVDPADAVARAWLGRTLCQIGRRFDGVAHLAAAGEALLHSTPITPDRLERAFEVLTQLHALGAVEPSLPLARRLAQLQPDSARAQYLLAATCGQLNLGPQAQVAIDAAALLAPDDPGIGVLHASLEADARRYESAYERLDALLERLSAAPQQGSNARHLFRALKEMARVLDALDETDGVFAQLEAAAQLVPLVPEYAALDLDVVPTLIARNAAALHSADLRRFAGDPFAEQPRAPVFVMGFYRSGTTLAQQVLRTHPEVFLSDEIGLLRAVERELDRLQPGPDSVPAKLARLARGDIVRLRNAYWRAALEHHGPACEQGVFVDKFTLATVDLGLIATVFPDARVLFVLRDPRDVCLSCVMQLMSPSPATGHLLRLADTAALYARVMDWWLQVRGKLSDQIHAFRYEDAVTDLEGTFRPIFDFIGLTWRDEALRFHEHGQGRYVASPSRNQVSRPLYRTAMARWRRYEREMAPVQAALAPFVVAFGYDAAD